MVKCCCGARSKIRWTPASAICKRLTIWCANASRSGIPRTGILDITIEECGLSRIPLGGLVQKLHQANLLTLYDAYRSEMRAARRPLMQPI